MALVLDFTLKMIACCNELQVCETTCEPNACSDTVCEDGYGVSTNGYKRDVDNTKFNFVFPNGTSALSVDLGYVPESRAYCKMRITGGTTGVVIADIGGLVLGSTVFVTDIATTVGLLINSINGNVALTGWQAFLLSGTTDTIIIQSIWSGVAYNGLTLTVSVSGDVTATTAVGTTEGGTASGCVDFGLSEIYGEDFSGQNFTDGVYTVTYITFNSSNVEIARVSKKFLIDCNVMECVKNLNLAESDCSCTDIDERLIKARLKIEQAHEQFNEGLYECANKTIIAAGKLCSNACLDC